MPRVVHMSCDQCEQKFSDVNALDLHLKQVHAVCRPFLCHLCPAKFANPSDLERHVETCKGNTENKTRAILPKENEVIQIPAPNAIPIPVSLITNQGHPTGITLPQQPKNSTTNKVRPVGTWNPATQVVTNQTGKNVRVVSQSGPVPVPKNMGVVSRSGPVPVPVAVTVVQRPQTTPSGVRVLGNQGIGGLPPSGTTTTRMVVPKELLGSIMKNPALLKTLPRTSVPSQGAGPAIVRTMNSAGNVRLTQFPAGFRPRIVNSKGTVINPNMAGLKMIPMSSMNLASTSLSTASMSTIGAPRFSINSNVIGTTATNLFATSGMSMSMSPSLTTASPQLQGPLEPFSCDTCVQRFKAISSLKSHFSQVHKGVGEISVSCFLCVMKFPQITELQEHIRSFVCPVDETGNWKGFGTMPSVPSGSIDILNPKLDQNGTLANLPSVSDLPGLKFERKTVPKPVLPPQIVTRPVEDVVISDSEDDDDVPLNKRNDKKSRPHECNVCHKRYADLGKFTEHYRKHVLQKNASLGTNPTSNGGQTVQRYPCNVCDKSFQTFESLFNHSKIHTGETPFPCKLCDLAFIDAAGLRTHLSRTHKIIVQTGRFLHCRVVTKIGSQYKMCHQGRFLTIKDLREHGIINHQGHCDLPCGCSRCGRSFQTVTKLEQHVEESTVCDVKVKLNEWIDNPLIGMPPSLRNKDFSEDLLVENPNLALEVESTPSAVVPAVSKTTNSKPVTGNSSKPVTTGVKIKNSRETLGQKRDLKVVLDRKTKCPRCNLRFANLENLMLHYNSRCDAIRLKNSIDYRSSAITALSRKERHHCVICGLDVFGDQYYKKHMEGHKNTDDFKKGKRCNLCPKLFYDMADFMDHWKTHGDDATFSKRHKRYLYPDSKFAKSRGITPDGLKPDSPTPDSNGKRTRSEAVTSALELQDTDTDSDAPATKKPKIIWSTTDKPDNSSKTSTRTLKFSKSCSICERVFTDMNTFIEHYRTHENGDERGTKNQNFSCHACPASFISRQVYLNHLKIHTGETPYTCKFCTEAFKTETDLGLHIPASHLKTKFFRLTEHKAKANSIKQVTSVSEMKLMLVIKAGQKFSKFTCKCLECDRSYTNFKKLKDHILLEDCAVRLRPTVLETKEKVETRYLCKICGNLYEKATALEGHIAGVHVVTSQSGAKVAL